MQVLDAAGLKALVSRFAREPRPGNQHGVWEWSAGSRDPARVALHLGDPDACVKLLHPALRGFLDAGYRPAGVIVTDRPLAAVHASRVALLGRSPNEDDLAASRTATLAALAAADVPWLDVPAELLVDEPAVMVPIIAGFLRPLVTVPVDETAMLAIPNPEDWHQR
jgi:hypothetical protein